jgi:hypothetical protein
VVRRRSVTPKLILESVEAKQDIEAAMDVPRAMVARFSTAISVVFLPKPSCCPIWVIIASARRKTYITSN